MKARLIKKIERRSVDAFGSTVYVRLKSWRLPHLVERKKGNGRFQRAVCRLDLYDRQSNDPIMRMSGCEGDFIRDWIYRDRQAGCPRCCGEMY